MNYLSVCSGIEAATVAWHHMGWKPVGFSEIEPFPSKVLAHHYPEVTNFGDMTKYKDWNLNDTVELLVGGTPCQSFSVAGLRKGLADPRGNLALVYLGIADHFKPKWIVWENVPGVLSSNGGRDFGSFLGALAELGYGFAYRVLDAQYFGVAQRRRRVFVVGCLGDWRAAAAVLFDSESLSGNPAPSREKRQEVAGTITTRTGVSRNNHEELIANAFTKQRLGEYSDCGVGSTCSARDYKDATDLVVPSYGIPGNWIGRAPENGGNAVEPMHDVSPCLTKTDRHGVAQPVFVDTYNGTITGDLSVTLTADCAGPTHSGPKVMQTVAKKELPLDPYLGGEVTIAIDASYAKGCGGTSAAERPVVVHPTVMQVRRLTPTECERLQGFPDSYTDIQPNGKQTPDGPRYKALGNSMAVPVMQWIGERIQMVENL